MTTRAKFPEDFIKDCKRAFPRDVTKIDAVSEDSRGLMGFLKTKGNSGAALYNRLQGILSTRHLQPSVFPPALIEKARQIMPDAKALHRNMDEGNINKVNQCLRGDFVRRLCEADDKALKTCTDIRACIDAHKKTSKGGQSRS